MQLLSLFLTMPILQLGVIGDAFGKLFKFLGDIFGNFFSFLGETFGNLFSYLGGLFTKLFNFLGDIFSKLFGVIWDGIKWVGALLKKLFQGLIDVLTIFFEAIFGLIAGLLYLLYMIGVLAVKLFLVIFETAKLLWSLAVGFTKSLASLSYTPKSSGGNSYSEVFGKMFRALEPLQLDVFAYIMLFVLWFSTCIAALKLLSSIRVGGE